MSERSSFLHTELPASDRDVVKDSVVAIGNFDGVHIGHQYVLQAAMDLAKAKNLACYALSFEPHPRTLFKPESPVFRLTSEPEKALVMQTFGLDGLLILPFTKELAGTSAEEFLRRHILQQANAKHIVTGFNFHFGKDRQGSPEFLSAMGAQHGFGVTIVEAQDDGRGELVSSSRIRRLLGEGNCVAAGELLGYRWIESGTVQTGQKIGRTLGYPTANLSLSPSCHLAHGIYAVKLRLSNGQLFDGVASYGRRPTFDNGEALLETFIFDFSGDIYGEQITVSLFDYLRGEEKFDNVDDLVKQMDKDSILARKLLAEAEPLSRLDQSLNFAQA